MKKIVVAAVGLLVCASVCSADVAQEVALAAESPIMIPGMVKTIDKASMPDFIAKLVKVLSNKPASPVARVEGLVEASKLVFSNVSQDRFADAIVASTANIPFNALPEWTRLCKATTKAIPVNMSDPQYDAVVNKVIKDIANLASVPKENKAVVTICALELLARGKTPEDEFAWINKIQGIPEGYRQDVLDGYKAMSRGDYSSLLGDTQIIKVPAAGEKAEEPAKAEEEKAPVAEKPAAKTEEKKAPAAEKSAAKTEEKKTSASEKAATAEEPAFRLVDPVEGPRPSDALVPGAENLHDTKVGDAGTGATGNTIDPFGTDRPVSTPVVKPVAPAPKPPRPVIPEPYRGQF